MTEFVLTVAEAVALRDFLSREHLGYGSRGKVLSEMWGRLHRQIDSEIAYCPEITYRQQQVNERDRT